MRAVRRRQADLPATQDYNVFVTLWPGRKGRTVWKVLRPITEPTEFSNRFGERASRCLAQTRVRGLLLDTFGWVPRALKFADDYDLADVVRVVGSNVCNRGGIFFERSFVGGLDSLLPGG
jgi:hypothetical protein